MLTIILEGAGGLLLCLAAGAVAFSPPHAPRYYVGGTTIAAIGIGLCFLAFGRIMGWPV